MYLLVIINMYSPTDMQDFEQILKMKMSADVLKAFGFVLPEEMSLTMFISSYFLWVAYLYASIDLYGGGGKSCSCRTCRGRFDGFFAYFSKQNVLLLLTHRAYFY